MATKPVASFISASYPLHPSPLHRPDTETQRCVQDTAQTATLVPSGQWLGWIGDRVGEIGLAEVLMSANGGRHDRGVGADALRRGDPARPVTPLARWRRSEASASGIGTPPRRLRLGAAGRRLRERRSDAGRDVMDYGRCARTLTTVPLGSSTKKRCTPQRSSVSG